MIVEVEHVMYLIAERAKINSVPLEEIEWYENGTKLHLSPEVVAHFADIGLNNIDFISSGEYKKAKVKE